CIKGFSVIPGLVEAVETAGLGHRKTAPGALVAGCELALEGLAAHQRITRTEEMGFTRVRTGRKTGGEEERRG
ncbi:MAG: hypothetical protein ACREL2_05760, partial [Gemmatimonadales bacterium]